MKAELKTEQIKNNDKTYILGMDSRRIKELTSQTLTSLPLNRNRQIDKVMDIIFRGDLK